VFVSDPAAERVRSLAERFGIAAVLPERAIETECDVFAP
jgi:hypothetical protein